MPIWVFEKIKSYLRSCEGITVDASAPGKVVLTDVFGFRYELSIKSLGRNQLWLEKEQENLSKEELRQINELANKSKEL